jgi:hypothetical protein
VDSYLRSLRDNQRVRRLAECAAQRHLYDNQGDERVRQAIRAITEDHVKRDAFGYAVFAQRGDADADIGFRLEMASAAFEDAEHAERALDYCRSHKAEPGVRYFVGKLSDLT